MCVEKNVFEFNESGLLPQGCHEITLEEIKKYFVDNFPVNFYKHEKIENISWKLWVFKINNPNLKHIHDYHILFYIHHHNIFYDSHQAN